MKCRFFVVFSKDALKLPKLYKREAFAEKKCTESPTYIYQSFFEEEEAEKFLNERLAQARAKQLETPLSTLKNNLSLKTNKLSIEEQPVPFSQTFIEQTQKQERQKIVNQILLQNRIFKQGRFKSSDAEVPLDVPYTGYFDGASSGNPGKSAIGYHIDNKYQKSLITRSEYIGTRSNSQAEMIALILLLGDAYCHGIKDMHCYGDSIMTIKFMTGEFQVQNKLLMYYFNASSALNRFFDKTQYTHIGRAYNYKADKLSRKPLNTTNYKPKQKSDFTDTGSNQNNNDNYN